MIPERNVARNVDDGAKTSTGGLEKKSYRDSTSTGGSDESFSFDHLGSYASFRYDDSTTHEISKSNIEDDFFESFLEPLESEEEEVPIAGDEEQDDDRRENLREMRRRQSSDSTSTGHAQEGGRQVVRANSELVGVVARRASTGRVITRRGLSASSSMMDFDPNSLHSGTQLSRERSKLCKLSRTSGHDSLPSRGFQRNRSSRSVVSNSSDDGTDGSACLAQLQVGDIFMLASKELSTSTHLKRQMPRSGSSHRGAGAAKSGQFAAHMNVLKA